MKIFHCTHCQQLVFFENVRCLNCGHVLAYLPDLGVMAALEPSGDGLWRAPGMATPASPPTPPPANATEPATPTEPATAPAPAYRLCANYDRENVCNWAIPADEAHTLCGSCQLTRVIPDLTQPANRAAWYRLEVAKRRLVYALLGLGLPVRPRRSPGDGGLAFEFLQETPGGEGWRVLTGHDNGLITINIAEADDVRREQQRHRNAEPYRTLLGHFRHEIGHYYWDRLIRDRPQLAEFRRLFGDERADYTQALERHYESGPPADWADRYISAYATAHPWEDWAETWAHFLHMTDALETAAATGLSLLPLRADEPVMMRTPDPLAPHVPDFDRMIADWLSLTYVLNNLNRGLGLPDGYPFVLSAPVIGKLRFVHRTLYITA